MPYIVALEKSFQQETRL